MIKKTLYFGNPVNLRLKERQLDIRYPEESAPSRTIPIEDIGLVILDSPQITISHGLIDAMVGNNAAIISCDAKHMPSGLFLPIAVADTFSEKLRFQLSASEPLKKQLWRQTIQAKILNQHRVLSKYGKPSPQMIHWSKNVGSGDPENLEGRAAAFYWKHLFQEREVASEEDFFRRDRYGEPPNQWLNYGYAVLRAITARSLVASGCLPALGIFHRNKYNAFCLADDIMEPYRPFVDDLVISMYKDSPTKEQDISKEDKQKLLKIPVLDVKIDDKSGPLMVAMQRTTSSLMKCYEGTQRKLMFPEFRPDVNGF